jgi:dienelactone hydrolase
LIVAAWLVIGPSFVSTAGPQDVSFKTDDGVGIAASLYLAARPGPAVILLHMQTRTREDWQGVASRLADAGLTALAIDFRGHGASDPPPAGSDAQDVSKMMADVKAAALFLASRRDVTPGRIGIAVPRLSRCTISPSNR